MDEYVFFSDLSEKLQTILLNYVGVSSPEEMNWDIFPITSISRRY
jgi:hypothetical protein